ERERERESERERMGRKPCCSKEGLNRGAWTANEDKILVTYISTHGTTKWGSLPKRAGLKRCGKSCRLRWLNYLRPGIKRGNISDDEEELIIRLHKLLGNRWSLIAGRLPGRTDNEIKNYWNTTLVKRLQGGSSQLPSNPSPATAQSKGKDTAVATPPPVTGSKVIQTKALRCTTAFFGQDTACMPPRLAPEESDGCSKISPFGSSLDVVAAFPSSSDAWKERDDGVQVENPESKEADDAANMGFYPDDLMSLDGALIGNWMEKDQFQQDSMLDVKLLASILEADEQGYWS
ncbi:unnamed protein product, partial [Musa banksii]